MHEVRSLFFLFVIFSILLEGDTEENFVGQLHNCNSHVPQFDVSVYFDLKTELGETKKNLSLYI